MKDANVNTPRSLLLMHARFGRWAHKRQRKKNGKNEIYLLGVGADIFLSTFIESVIGRQG